MQARTSRAIGPARIAALVCGTWLIPCVGTAQDSVPWPRADRLAVTVHARLVSPSADSVRLEYEVTNSGASEQAAMRFAVRTDLPRYRAVGPTLWWASNAVVQDSGAAYWFILDPRAVIRPGATLSGFLVRAVGLTEPVAYRVQGFHEPPPVAEGQAVQTPPSLWVNSVAGVTVGVAPFPSDSSPAAAVSRLGTLTARACDLAWVTADVCNDLTGEVEAGARAVGEGDLAAAHARIQDFRNKVLALADESLALLEPNADFALRQLKSGVPPAATAFFLKGAGGTANPPTLSLSIAAPTGTTAKYQDSPSINYNGGNPWAEVGTWTAAPALVTGTLTALGEATVWLGLKNSDDQGTYFDVRVEVSRNGTLLASGETRCVQGVTRNPANAKAVSVALGPVTPASFNGTTDVLSLRVLTRIGTTETGARCGGHANAVGLRLYFDAASRAAQVAATF